MFPTNISYPSNTLSDKLIKNGTITNLYTNKFIKGPYSTWKLPVKVATNQNISLSGEQTINGVALSYGDRVLVKNQTNSIDNGIYIVNRTWYRSDDLSQYTSANGIVIYSSGSEPLYSWNTYYLCTSNPAVVGVNQIEFEEMNGSNVQPEPVTYPLSHPTNMFVQDSIVDSNDNIYFTGTYYGESYIYNRNGTIAATLPNLGDGRENMFIAKMNSEGFITAYSFLNCNWVSHGSSISIDESNNVYLAGNYTNNLNLNVDIYSFTFFPEASSYQLPYITPIDIGFFVIKWNSSGDVASFTYSENLTELQLLNIKSKNGIVYLSGIYLNSTATNIRTLTNVPLISGYTLPATTNYNIFLLKWSEAGEKIELTYFENIVYNFNTDSLYSKTCLNIDTNNSVYLAAKYTKTSTGNIPIKTISTFPSNSGYTIPCVQNLIYTFIIKWDSTGNVNSFTYFETDESYIYSIITDNNNNLYASGNYFNGSNVVINTFSLTPSSTSKTLSNTFNSYIIKWNSNGTLNAYTYMNAINFGINIDSQNSVYSLFVGTSTNYLVYTIANTPVSTGITITNPDNKYFFVKWLSNGSLSTFNNFTEGDALGTGYFFGQSSSITIDSSFNLYLFLSFANTYPAIPIYDQRTNTNPVVAVFSMKANPSSLLSNIYVKWNSDGTVSEFSDSDIVTGLIPGGTQYSIQVNKPIGTFFGSSNFIFNGSTALTIGGSQKNANIVTAIDSGPLYLITPNAEDYLDGKDINITALNNFNQSFSDINILTNESTTGNSGNIEFLTGNGISGVAGDIIITTADIDYVDSDSRSNYILFESGTSTGLTSSAINIIAGTNSNSVYNGIIKIGVLTSPETDVLYSVFEEGGLTLVKETATVSTLSPTVTTTTTQGFITVTDVSIAALGSVSITVRNPNLNSAGASSNIISVGIQQYSGLAAPSVQVRSISLVNPASFTVLLFNMSTTQTLNSNVTFAYVIF